MSAGRPACAPESSGDAPGAPDDAALAELYRREAPGLTRMLARRGGDPDAARDLVQDTFLRLARAGGAAALERPQAYLRRVASNLLKDRARTATRRASALHVVADDAVLPAVDPLRQLESRDMLRRVEAAIARLRPKTRAIFIAHRVEGLSYAEIAARTGLTVKGVEKQMSKALVTIDRLIARS